MWCHLPDIPLEVVSYILCLRIGKFKYLTILSGCTHFDNESSVTVMLFLIFFFSIKNVFALFTTICTILAIHNVL